MNKASLEMYNARHNRLAEGGRSPLEAKVRVAGWIDRHWLSVQTVTDENLAVSSAATPKSVFQLAVADSHWKLTETHRLTRSQFERWFHNHNVSLVMPS